jgi:arsenate reductase (thioredoxin)
MKDHRPMKLLKLAACAALILSTAGASPPEKDDVGPMVRALWLVQRHGTLEAADPRNDLRTKGSLAKALGKEGILTPAGIKNLMDPSEFAKLAGPDGRLDPAEVRLAVEADVPESRGRLLPKVAAHADLLTTSFDLIDEPHREAGATLADWIVANYQAGRPLHVTVICTGNSRRSILGATMGNVASAYYGLPEVRFHSGGTAPSAFNTRTIAALREVGVEVEPTGDQAPRGEPSTANPVYRVRWGQPVPSGEPALEAIEFSKKYGDATNPQAGFAALMVCGEADEGCPLVKGAALRVSMPYLDPKIYDGGAYEALKYAERRDDMGRLMMSALMKARRLLPD